MQRKHPVSRPGGLSIAMAIAGTRSRFSATGITSARIGDAWLGGTGHSPADQETAEALTEHIPAARSLALASRVYVTEAQARAARAGVRQFIDLGCGLPAFPYVHDIARAHHPGSRVIYVDHDPHVILHVRGLRAGKDVGIVRADITVPAAVTRNWTVQRLIRPDRPVCMTIGCALHWCDGDLTAVMDAYQKWLPAGSWLVITHVVSDYADPGTLEGISRVFAGRGCGLTLRSSREVFGLFGGFGFAERPEILDGGRKTGVAVAAGIAIKPQLPSACWGLAVPRQVRSGRARKVTGASWPPGVRHTSAPSSP